MFADELAKINEIENKADRLYREAKAESRQLMDEAKMEAKRIVEQAEERAKDVYDSHIEEGRRISEKNYDEFLGETARECEDMVERAKGNINAAVEVIVERIVGSHGNH